MFNYCFHPDAEPDQHQEAMQLLAAVKLSKRGNICDFLRTISGYERFMELSAD